MIFSKPKPVKAVAEQPSRPSGRVYWVTEKVLAGEHPAASEDMKESLQGLLRENITFYLDVTEKELDE